MLALVEVRSWFSSKIAIFGQNRLVFQRFEVEIVIASQVYRLQSLLLVKLCAGILVNSLYFIVFLIFMAN